jgi:spore photoproduct lyase
MKIIKQKTKTLITRNNDRSSDAISPNFVYGCLGGCMQSYCYVARYNPDKVYSNTNTKDILNSIDKWLDDKPFPKIPNQVDDTYYCLDVGCSTDLGLMYKYYDWQKVFDYFNETTLHDNSYKAKSTFATKYPTKFKDYNLVKDKHRIRVSLMPQEYSDVLEPHTDKIINRIKAISRLQDIMEVHINFSPVIVPNKEWRDKYKELFKQIKDNVDTTNLKCEVIFATYSDIQKEVNSQEVNSLLVRPELQEYKYSEYGGKVIRYKHQDKAKMIEIFKELLYENLDINIRYIF